MPLARDYDFAGTPPILIRSQIIRSSTVASPLDLGVQRLGRAPLVLGPPRVGLQGLLEHLVEIRQLVGLLTAPVLRRAVDLAMQPLRDRVARQPRDARDLALRLLLPAVQPPDPANHVHGDHSSSSAAQKCSRVGRSPGSVLGRHNPQKWLTFRSAPTDCPSVGSLGPHLERVIAQSEMVNCLTLRRLAPNVQNPPVVIRVDHVSGHQDEATAAVIDDCR